MKLTPNFYKNRVCLNVLAGSIQNAVDVYQAAEGHVIVGLLSKNYPSVEKAVENMREYAVKLENAISVGLGAGAAEQAGMVAAISEQLHPQHVNQVFTGVGLTRGKLQQNDTFVNGLISPTGKAGFVKISTGPLSSKEKDGIVPVETAIALLKDMGGSSVKFFPMKGLGTIEEYKQVAAACAANHFSLEPTGGIDLENFETILTIALQAGVEKIIPHVYSSIVDSETGETRPQDVSKLFDIVKKLVG